MIRWCATPGCRNHVHYDGPEESMRTLPIPHGWSYVERHRGWVAECPEHDYGHPQAHAKNPSAPTSGE